jgi:hypothetical protein
MKNQRTETYTTSHQRENDAAADARLAGFNTPEEHDAATLLPAKKPAWNPADFSSVKSPYRSTTGEREVEPFPSIRKYPDWITHKTSHGTDYDITATGGPQSDAPEPFPSILQSAEDERRRALP